MIQNNIWLVDPYSDFPEDNWRNGRYILIADKLSLYGYNVTLFISNYSHREKRFINKSGIILYKPNFNIVIVPTSSYINHISIKRILYEKRFAKGVTENVHKLELPNILILKEPAIFMFDTLKPLLKTSNAKIIVDIIDLWPELFELKLPNKLRWLGKFIFYPFYFKRNKIYNYASAFTAVAPDYLEIAKNINPRVLGDVIYWGCDTKLIDSMVNFNDDQLLPELNITKKADDVWGIYAGTLGENYDIITLLKAAAEIKYKSPNLKILIAGAGPLYETVSNYAKENENIYFLGSLPTIKLYKLFKYCDFGFSTYSKVSTVSMPIKCYDYIAAGLPLVNSLQRNLGFLVQKYSIGYQYTPGNHVSLENILLILINEKDNLKKMKERCLSLSKAFDNEEQYIKFLLIVNDLKNDFPT